MNKFKLIRTVQCAKCPWKKSTNPLEIPDGYSVEKHANLISTIATDPVESILKPTTNMACHHSTGNDDMYCIGWLYNQMGTGNNVGLRMRMSNCININQLKIKGIQHEHFADTLPTGK